MLFTKDMQQTFCNECKQVIAGIVVFYHFTFINSLAESFSMRVNLFKKVTNHFNLPKIVIFKGQKMLSGISSQKLKTAVDIYINRLKHKGVSYDKFGEIPDHSDSQQTTHYLTSFFWKNPGK